MSQDPPLFFADVMLGRLARRLRLAGFDTAYENDIEDGDLARRASEQGRIILTRDRLLTQRRLARGAILIHSTEIDEQWQELLRAMPGLSEGPILSRCSACNVATMEIPLEDARALVPPHIAETHSRYVQCPQCRRVFWEGTHAPRIRQALRGAGEGNDPA